MGERIARTRERARSRPAETSAGAAGSLAALVLWALGLAGIEEVPIAAVGGITLVAGWIAAAVTGWVERRREQ